MDLFSTAPDQLAINRWLLAALLTAEAALLFVVRLAGTLQFDSFAFFDTGANLTAQSLIARGYRPTIDFSYHYGLLPLLFGHLWFGLLGLTPLAAVALLPVLDILLVWGLVRFAVNLELNAAGVLIILLTASVTIPSAFLNLAHIIEPVLLVHALACQAGGNRRGGLLLATVCLFVKPSMAYFLGLLLMVFAMLDCRRNREGCVRRTIAMVYPSALVAILIVVMLAAAFGLAAAATSMVPGEGMAMYRAAGFGFLNGAGRSFLAPAEAPWAYYFANMAGPWILYTGFLLAAVGKAITEDAGLNGRASEVLVTCAALHFCFVLFFFGNEFSWIYYFPLLVLGVAAATSLGRRWSIAVACLALAFPLTKVDKRIIQYLSPARQSNSQGVASSPSTAVSTSALGIEPAFTYQLWFTTVKSAETAGLRTTPQELAEWRRVLKIVEGQRAAILAYYGCAELLFPQFVPPVTLYLIPGIAASDISRKVAQLKTATMIVMPRWQRGLLDELPAIGGVVREGFVPVFEGKYFIVYAKAYKGSLF